MIDKIKKNRDSKGAFTAILTDLSKAFDCICNELLITKLNASGFEEKSLIFISAYLDIINFISEILFGIPQGSIAGPLLFNVYTCDMFFIHDSTEFASSADNTTP